MPKPFTLFIATFALLLGFVIGVGSMNDSFSNNTNTATEVTGVLG